MVRKEGFEPSQAFAYGALNTACLPFHHFRTARDSLAHRDFGDNTVRKPGYPAMP